MQLATPKVPRTVSRASALRLTLKPASLHGNRAHGKGKVTEGSPRVPATLIHSRHKGAANFSEMPLNSQSIAKARQDYFLGNIFGNRKEL